MKPIIYLRIASITLFWIGISSFAMADEGGAQSYGVMDQVPAAASQVTEEASGVQEIVGQTGEEGSPVIARAQFTTKVVNREPIDQLDSIDASVSPVYFFTELTNMSGQTVTHRWLYNGTQMAEVKIAVNSDRWRAYSTKNMMPYWTGTWIVAVLDGEGNEITRKTFDYAAPDGPADMAGISQVME